MTRKTKFLHELDALINKYRYDVIMRDIGGDEHFLLEISLTEERPRSVQQLETAAIEKLLHLLRWDINKAAKALGVTERQLKKKMKAYNIERTSL